MFNPDFTEKNFEAKDNFVSVLDGERKRQEAVAVHFREREPALYKRALEAVIGMQRAADELAAARDSVSKSLQPGVALDLFSQVEAEARTMLRQQAPSLTISQIEQSLKPLPTEPDLVVPRKVSTKAKGEKNAIISEDKTELVPAAPNA